MNNKYAFSFDGEDYCGCTFDSIDEALEEACKINKESYDSILDQVWIGQTKVPELKWITNEDDIIDSIMQNLYEDCGEFADCFGVTTDVEIDLGKMLDNTVKEWIKKHNLKPNCFTVTNPELYIL